MKREVNIAPPVRNFPIGFNPVYDMQEVEQFGFVNLAEAYDKGIVPSGGNFNEEAFNGCINPGTLISRSSDIFDGLRKREYVQSMLSKLNAVEREKVEKAIARQSEKEGQIYARVTPEE